MCRLLGFIFFWIAVGMIITLFIIAGCNRYVRYGIITLLSIVEIVVISAWYFWDGLLM